jgi:hypothetical protein
MRSARGKPTPAGNDLRPLALRTDIKRPHAGDVAEFPWYDLNVKKIARVTLSTFIVTSGLGLAGLGAASVAQAQPVAPFPQWCPGEFWDPGWGFNPDGFHCHDGGPGWRGGGGPGWHNEGPGWHEGPGGPGWNHDDGRGWR